MGIYFCVFLESRAICDRDIFVIHMQSEWTVFQTFNQLLAITLANVWVPDSPIAKIKNHRNFWNPNFWSVLEKFVSTVQYTGFQVHCRNGTKESDWPSLAYFTEGSFAIWNTEKEEWTL